MFPAHLLALLLCAARLYTLKDSSHVTRDGLAVRFTGRSRSAHLAKLMLSACACVVAVAQTLAVVGRDTAPGAKGGVATNEVVIGGAIPAALWAFSAFVLYLEMDVYVVSGGWAMRCAWVLAACAETLKVRAVARADDLFAASGAAFFFGLYILYFASIGFLALFGI